MRLAGAAAALALVSIPAPAIELLTDTVEAFDRFVASAEGRMEPRHRGKNFLWSDDLPAVKREPLQRGEILVQGGENGGLTEVKNGVIHDWLGAVFIPGATLAQTLNVVQDYPHHPLIYKPEVEAAQIRSRAGDNFHVFMRIVKSKFFLTDVLNADLDIRFVALDSRHVYSSSHSNRIAEVSDAGKPSEHELPVGRDRGLLWRLNGYWFFEERDGGVYIECEEISLSRQVPLGMGKLMGPIMHSVPAESLRISLDETRRALLSK